VKVWRKCLDVDAVTCRLLLQVDAVTRRLLLQWFADLFFCEDSYYTEVFVSGCKCVWVSVVVIHWLLMLRFLDALHLPSCVPLMFSFEFMPEFILEMAWHWSRQSHLIVEFGSLHKMQWGWGRIDDLWRWAAGQLCHIYSPKSATGVFLGRLGINLSLHNNMPHTVFYISCQSLLQFLLCWCFGWLLSVDRRVRLCLLISVPFFARMSTLSLLSVPQWEGVYCSTICLCRDNV
jgi:hypothetical protein